MVLLSAAFVGASGMSYEYDPEVVPVISDGKIPGQMVLTRIFILSVSLLRGGLQHLVGASRAGLTGVNDQLAAFRGG